MKTLDRYVIRSFLGAALLWLVVLMALRIVVDLFVNMDEFAKLGLPLGELMHHIARYYSYQSLVYFMELGGIGIVAAAAFTLARMNHSNELTAILASGVSLHRVVWPLVLFAVLLGAMIVADQELIIPRVGDRLVRTRDDVPGTREFKVPLVSDAHGAVFWSPTFRPETGEMNMPMLHIRDVRESAEGAFRALAAVAAHHARPGTLDGKAGWFFHDAVLMRTLNTQKAWENMPDTERVYTYVGPADIFKAAKRDYEQREGKPMPAEVQAILDARARIQDPQYDLTIEADRFKPLVNDKTRGVYGGTLIHPRFTFTSPEGGVLGTFFADQAVWDPQTPTAWKLQGGTFFRESDLDSRYLVLRQSGRWLNLMSTRQLSELIQLKRLPDPRPAVLTLHTRFTDPINNLVMLLLGLPFILSRERGIKTSAARCLLVVSVFYVSIYVCRYVGLPPEWAAWLPILTFGPLAMVLMDSVKT